MSATWADPDIVNGDDDGLRAELPAGSRGKVPSGVRDKAPQTLITWNTLKFLVCEKFSLPAVFTNPCGGMHPIIPWIRP